MVLRSYGGFKRIYYFFPLFLFLVCCVHKHTRIFLLDVSFDIPVDRMEWNGKAYVLVSFFP